MDQAGLETLKQTFAQVRLSAPKNNRQIIRYIKENLVGKDDLCPVPIEAISYTIRRFIGTKEEPQPPIWEVIPDLLELLAHMDMFHRRTVATVDEVMLWQTHFVQQATHGERVKVLDDEQLALVQGIKEKDDEITRLWHAVSLQLRKLHLRQILMDRKYDEFMTVFRSYFAKRVDYTQKAADDPTRRLFLDIISEKWQWQDEARTAVELLQLKNEVLGWDRRRTEFWNKESPNLPEKLLYGETEFTSYYRDFNAAFPPTVSSWDMLMNVTRRWVEKIEKEQYGPLRKIFFEDVMQQGEVADAAQHDEVRSESARKEAVKPKVAEQKKPTEKRPREDDPFTPQTTKKTRVAVPEPQRSVSKASTSLSRTSTSMSRASTSMSAPHPMGAQPRSKR